MWYHWFVNTARSARALRTMLALTWSFQRLQNPQPLIDYSSANYVRCPVLAGDFCRESRISFILKGFLFPLFSCISGLFAQNTGCGGRNLTVNRYCLDGGLPNAGHALGRMKTRFLRCGLRFRIFHEG